MSEFYDNLVLNPGAETGDLAHWNYSNVSVVTGGTDTDENGKILSHYCFKVNPNGALSQNITFDKSARTFDVSFLFLPKYPVDDINNLFQVNLDVMRDNGKLDQYVFPLKQHQTEDDVTPTEPEFPPKPDYGPDWDGKP